MSAENLALWQSVERTDPAHTKPITGKPYKGNSPKPHFLVYKATERFGPCGIGWGVEIVNERIEEGALGDKLHIAHVRVWYVLDGTRGVVEHVGQTMFSGKRADGKTYLDEDAPKKSVTDAMVKALSMIGFAGDIFMGRYDDSKYINEIQAEFKEQRSQDQRQDQFQSDESVGVYMQTALAAIAAASTPDALKTWWFGQAEMRQRLGVIKGARPYADLYDAFLKRGEQVRGKVAA